MSFAHGPSPFEIEMLAHQERDLREQLAVARDRHRGQEGDIPREHHELIHRLEAEWKSALERLEHARKS